MVTSWASQARQGADHLLLLVVIPPRLEVGHVDDVVQKLVHDDLALPLSGQV